MKPPTWIHRCGRENVLASRVRLSRNIPGTPFRGTVSPHEGRRFCEKILEALKGRHPAFVPLADETSEDALALAAFQRIPANLVSPEDPGPWLAMEDSGRGVLVLDGDHLRFWSMLPGSALPEALESAAELESVASTILPFAQDPDRGWLTASPIEAGTGLRATLMLHLPALWSTARMLGVPEAMEAMGFPLRGLDGGQTSADETGLVLLTHAKGLGTPESEVIASLARAGELLSSHEDQARDALVEERSDELEDAVFRSVSVLGSARLLSRRELSARVRWISIGARLGWVDPTIAASALEAHLRTDDRSLLARAGGPREEFVDGLDRMRARETTALVRRAIDP